LGPRCGIRRRCLAPRTMTCSGISSSLSRCPASAGLPVAHLSAEIMNWLTDTLVLAGPELPDTQPVRRELIRRVIALDPIMDQPIGESLVLQRAGGCAGAFGLRTLASGHFSSTRALTTDQQTDCCKQPRCLHLSRLCRETDRQHAPRPWTLTEPLSSAARGVRVRAKGNE
jgi:hypothetical protein